MTKQEKEIDIKEGTAQVTTHTTQTGIIITPTILIGTVFILLQVLLGLFIWSINGKIQDYDNYDERILNNEQSLIRLEDVVDSVENLNDNFREFTRKPVFEESDGKELALQMASLAEVVRELQNSNTRMTLKLDNLESRFSNFERNVSEEQTRQWTRINDIKNAVLKIAGKSNINLQEDMREYQ